MKTGDIVRVLGEGPELHRVVEGGEEISFVENLESPGGAFRSANAGLTLVTAGDAQMVAAEYRDKARRIEAAVRR